MEIQILSPTQAQPLPPVEWNYPEIKKWIEDGLARYKGVVYDETQIAIAKKDRASLNKLADAIDSKRKEMKATYLQPYMDFEAQAKDLVAMVKAQVAEIDIQVKTYDDAKRQEKYKRIKAELYEPMIVDLADLVPYDRLHDPKWLNVTCSASTVSTELGRKIENIYNGISAIEKMGLSPDMENRIKGVFLKRFDLAAAIAEKESIEKQQASLAEYEAKKKAAEAARAEESTAPKYTPAEPAEPVAAHQDGDRPTEPIHTVVFRIRVTSAQLKGLGDYMRANNIKPERV